MDAMLDDHATTGSTVSFAAAAELTAAGSDWRRLFAAIADGDATALELLYDAAAAPIYGLALCRTRSRDDAADVLAETFVRVAEQGERLRRVRDPRAWLLTVASRLAVDVMRQRSRHAAGPSEEAEFVAAPARDPGRAVDARRAAGLLARLPEAQREAVYLRHFTACSFAAIGRITGVPTFTAASSWPIRFQTDLDLLAPLGDGPANAAEFLARFENEHGARAAEAAAFGARRALPPRAEDAWIGPVAAPDAPCCSRPSRGSTRR